MPMRTTERVIHDSEGTELSSKGDRSSPICGAVNCDVGRAERGSSPGISALKNVVDGSYTRADTLEQGTPNGSKALLIRRRIAIGHGDLLRGKRTTGETGAKET